MDRCVEPQLVEDPESVKVLAESFSELERDFFLSCLEKYFRDDVFLESLDLCCGTGDFDIALANNHSMNIDAVDGSSLVLEVAKQNILNAGLADRITTQKLHVPFLVEKKYDLIFSLNSLHHFHDPADLWLTIKNHSKEGTKVLVIDLQRPTSKETARDIVNFYEANESQHHRTDAYNSLLAAFESEEIINQLKDVQLDLNVEKIKTRCDGLYIIVVWGTVKL